MRRIALLLPLLGLLAIAAPAHADDRLIACDRVYTSAYVGWDVGEHNLGCAEARKMVLHAIEHGASYTHLTCTYTPHAGLPRTYQCDGLHHGVKLVLHFKISKLGERGGSTLFSHETEALTLKPCTNVYTTYRVGYAIGEHGLGCAEAHKMVRHVIDRSGAYPGIFQHLTCTSTGTAANPHHACSGSHDGHQYRLDFSLRFPTERDRNAF